MPLTREQKGKIVKKIEDNLKKQKILLFVTIAGLKTKDIFDLKRKLKEKDCLLTVVKKTLFKIASKKQSILLDIEKLEGELALVFGFSDEVSAAKVVNQFNLANKNLNILGGFFEKNFIGKEQITVLANIPSRQELLAKLVGSISSPIAGFANVLQGNIKGLIIVLSKLKT